MRPRLTIGIPTFKRDPLDHLQYAVDSCLQQTIPVKIVVADQGHTDAVVRYMARYRDHPNVRHVLTDAKILWDNWTAASKACDTEFFAWLQDDDTIQPPYADRVCRAFDAFPDALHWQAFCYVTPDRIHALRWAWNGPQVGVNMRYNLAEKWHGEYCVATMYLMSWALSPGVAFRCAAERSRMRLRRCPEIAIYITNGSSLPRWALAAIGLRMGFTRGHGIIMARTRAIGKIKTDRSSNKTNRSSSRSMRSSIDCRRGSMASMRGLS